MLEIAEKLKQGLLRSKAVMADRRRDPRQEDRTTQSLPAVGRRVWAWLPCGAPSRPANAECD